MIELSQVFKQYQGVPIIKGISLTIKKGEVVGLLGPNGAGKTTTVRMIAGVLPPSQGTVIINGQNLFSEQLTHRPHIGYLPENNPLYDDMTVEEFLLFWMPLKGLNVKESSYIHQAVAAAGLQEVYYRPIAQLSKGYRQRVGLAQAILSQPELLLLDEPTEGLDPNQRKDIHHLIKGLGKERTVIICSHVLPEITKMCDRIIIIHHGKVVADSPTKDLSGFQGGKQIYEIVASGRTIQADIQQLDKTEVITSQKDSSPTRWVIKVSHSKDLRLEIFELAKKKNWKLYELVRKQQDLEEVFERLTKN